MTNSIAEDQKIREWQKDVVKSIADDTPEAPYDPPPSRLDPAPARSIPPAPPTRPVVINQIVTSPQVVVTRVKAPEPKPSDEISTKAMIGTVAGATAGAFIAYAMVKGGSESHQPAKLQERITYRTIKAPVEYTVTQPRRIPIQDSRSHYYSYANDNSGVRTIAPTPARAETLVSASQPSRHPHSQSYKVIPRDGPIVMIDNEKPYTRSRASTAPTPIKPRPLAHPAPTELRTAREIPLPVRSHPSQYSRGTSATIHDPVKPRSNPPPSLSPQDSISQASTRRSKPHRSSHHGRSRDGSRSEKEYESARGSKRGGGSRVGDMVDDVVGIIRGAGSRGSEYRSLRA